MSPTASPKLQSTGPPHARLAEAVRLIAANPQAGMVTARRVLADCPDLPVAHRVVALAERRLGHEAEAQQRELAAIALSLRLPRLREAQDAIAGERIADAEPLVRAHLKEDPEDPAAALILGEIALRSGAKPQAENLFRRAILLAPGYAEARVALAKLQRDAGRFDEALGTAEALLALDPTHLSGLSLKAGVAVQLRDFAAADTTFRELLAHHPDDARAWANHAFQLKTVGKLDEAVAAYRRALEIEPAHPHAWWGLANLKTVRFSDEDIAILRAALARDEF